MAIRKRDYRDEYERRIARGLAQNLSRSQARGHPKATERAASAGKRPPQPIEADRFQRALTRLRQEKNLTKAAREIHVSPERLRRYASDAGAIEKAGRSWRIKGDLPRRVQIYSRGRAKEITVADSAAASLVGRYMAAIQKFRRSGNLELLSPFAGQSVADLSGNLHEFEVDPNALFRLVLSNSTSFEQVYRIII